MTNPPVYNPNVPNRKDALEKSQRDFLGNFSTLYNAFLANHVPLDATSGAGNHTIIEMLQQTTSFQTNVGEISIYSKDAPGQTDQLFLRYQGNGQEIQLTNYQIYPIQSSPAQTTFITFLPGRILLYFGTIFSFGSSAHLVLDPPIAKNIFTMNFCAGGSTPALIPWSSVQAPNSNGFYTLINLNQTAPGFGYFYIVGANI